MNRGSQSQLNRNKMTTLPPVSNLVKSRLEAASKNMSTNKKLRTELRRVMSDRVMKITKCSQQQTVEKINQLKAAPPPISGPRAIHVPTKTTPALTVTNLANTAMAPSATNLNTLNKSDALSVDPKPDDKKQEQTIETNKSIVIQSISNFVSPFL